MRNKGLLLVICGPSGVGKGTVCNKIIDKNDSIKVSVSATTRLPRPNEVDGKNYYFLKTNKFEEMIQNNDFLEWAKYCNNYYGTPKKKVLEMLDEGIDVILEIDVQGAMQVKKIFPLGIFIFIIPPDVNTLKERLKSRGTETKDIIEKRLAASNAEYKFIDQCSYIIINDVIDNAVSKIEAIITAEKCKKNRMIDYVKGEFEI